MLGKSKLQKTVVLGLIFMASCGLFTKESKAFCSCWNSGLISAECGWGLDWDTNEISHVSCGILCERYAPPGFNWPNVTEYSLNRCKNEQPNRVKRPDEDSKRDYLRTIWGPGSVYND